MELDTAGHVFVRINQPLMHLMCSLCGEWGMGTGLHIDYIGHMALRMHPR